MRLFAIGNYNTRCAAVWYKVILAKDSDHAWKRGSLWMDMFVGEPIEWLMEAKDFDQAKQFIEFCDRGEYDANAG